MRMLAFVLLFAVAGIANALPRVEDVQSAVNRGDYPAAESMVREVLGAKPENAKAHYLLAEILAHEGRIVEATRQAAMARQYDPQIRFTSPERFAQFEARLAKATPGHGGVPAQTTPPDSALGGATGTWVLLALGIGAAFLFLRRRNAPANYGNPGNYGAPAGPASGMPPGYPSGYPPNYPQGGGAGRTVAAGLGGLAAGMLAEHLIEGAMGHHPANANPLDPAATDPSSADAFRDQPIDFGSGSDWDSGSSGGGDGGGFDSGGGGDW